jgi:hypothetical protein
MADNLKDLKAFKDQVLDTEGGPESVTVVNHNDLEDRIISQLGRYTGFPFVAKKVFPSGVMATGAFYWGNNSMNTETPFSVKFSSKTADGTNLSSVLSIVQIGAILKTKDFVGRAGIFEITSIDTFTDTASNLCFDLNITGNADNPNYTFGDSESEPIFLEFINISNSTPPSGSPLKTTSIIIASDGSSMDSSDLVGATNVISIMSQTGGIKTEGYTFDGVTGTISGIDVYENEVYIINYK